MRITLASLIFGFGLSLSSTAWGDPVPSGLVTQSGPAISGEQLRFLLDTHVPTDNAKSTLVLLTQCYGGNMVDLFEGRANTAVLSATSEGQRAYYGGFDDDAARELRPEGWHDSDKLFDRAVSGSELRETPRKIGPNVSLVHVQEHPFATDEESGEILSRHIVVYAGQPDGGRVHNDEAFLKTIRENFEGQPNTDVTSVGGTGEGAWDYPGTFEGLRDALREKIKPVMNPNEQFILFVTDHGTLLKTYEPDGCGVGGGLYSCDVEVGFPADLVDAHASSADTPPSVCASAPYWYYPFEVEVAGELFTLDFEDTTPIDFEGGAPVFDDFMPSQGCVEVEDLNLYGERVTVHMPDWLEGMTPPEIRLEFGDVPKGEPSEGGTTTEGGGDTTTVPGSDPGDAVDTGLAPAQGDTADGEPKGRRDSGQGCTTTGGGTLGLFLPAALLVGLRRRKRGL